jgi:hypothetical protein
MHVEASIEGRKLSFKYLLAELFLSHNITRGSQQYIQQVELDRREWQLFTVLFRGA